MDVAGFLFDFVRSPFADDIALNDAELNYVNKETGFTIRYAFDSISSKPGAGGTVLVAGIGKINGEPWKANGEVDPPGENEISAASLLPARRLASPAHLPGLIRSAIPMTTSMPCSPEVRPSSPSCSRSMT
jgi:hypothetical protein